MWLLWPVIGRKRAAPERAGLEIAIAWRTFRVTAISEYPTNGANLTAQRMAGHSNATATVVYDRRNDDSNVS